MKYIKTYGIKQLNSGRWAIALDVSEDKKYYSVKQELAYKRQDFAIEKAKSFIKRCYKNFRRGNGELVEFEFKNMGII